MAAVAAALRGSRAYRDRLGPECVSADVHVPGGAEGRGDVVVRGIQPRGKPDLVVIGNAISRGNPEAEAVLDRKLRYCSLPELLKEFFIQGKRSIVVSGTHGKTTTTSLLAWVFEQNGLNPSFLIGGIPNNFGEGARFTDSPWFIIEGDEYDTAFFDKRSKFVHYLPEIALSIIWSSIMRTF